MRAGDMREFLDFYEMRETTSPSGAFKRDWVKVFSRRAMFKRSRPVYDKDGVEARELYRGATHYMVIRMDNDVHTGLRVGYKGNRYEIILIEPNHRDRTNTIQIRRLNE